MAPILSLLTLACLAANAFAHPGASEEERRLEFSERAEFFTRNPKTVRSCAESPLRRRGVDAALARRQGLARELRAKRGLVRRDFAEYNFSHLSDLDTKLGDDETILFSDDSSCTLQPEVVQGPYFIDGEIIRSNMVEDQTGVPLYVDVQFVNADTCEPLTSVYVEAWHCNSTGVYSGIVVNSNGNDEDTTNINTTFLRGLQQTDTNGVIQFETLFPGHYGGRATHIHIITHNVEETIIRTNGTLLSSNQTVHATHVGQLFFDQDLINKVEATIPYSTNTIPLTTNAEDGFLATEADGADPFFEYIYINPDDLSDGLLAWITVGVDPTRDYDITLSGTYYATGGTENLTEIYTQDPALVPNSTES